MKIFRRKKPVKGRDQSSADPTDSEHSVYTRGSEQESLDEFSQGPHRRTSHTSRHSPARRRENSNRASNRQIFFLLFRVGLIVVLLAGGYLALKQVLGKMAEPTEKDVQKWEQSAELMEKGGLEDLRAIEPASASVPVEPASAAVVEKRLRKWIEAERHMRSAESMERRGINDEAVLRLGQALRSAPDHRAAQHLLMKIHMSSGKYAQAIPLCIRLLDQDSQQWDVKRDLLKALHLLGQTDACLILAEQMLGRQPNDLEVLEVAALAQRVGGNDEKALALFGHLLEYNSRHQVALAGSGAIYQDRGEWEEAIPYYMELVQTHPAARYYHELVRCYARQAEAGKAMLFMGQAASLYGEAEVGSWMQQDLEAFDRIRETVEYRSFADRLVGVEARKSIEAIRKREVERQAPQAPRGLDLPTQPELQLKAR